MPRDLSTAALAALFAQETGEALIVLLELSHPTLAEPIRAANNHEPITSNGVDYPAYPFEASLAGEEEDRSPTARIRIDNVDRSIVRAVREIVGEPLTARLSIVLASTPDQVEVGPLNFKIRQVDYDAQVVEGELLLEDVLNTPCPAHRFTPADFPGLA